MVRVKRKKQKRQQGLDVKTGKSVPVITKRGNKEKTLEKREDVKSVEKEDLNPERKQATAEEQRRNPQVDEAFVSPIIEDLDAGDNKGILEKANEFLKDPFRGESLATAGLGLAEKALRTEGVGLQVSSEAAHEIGTTALFTPLLTARSKTLVAQRAHQVTGRVDPNFVVKLFKKKGADVASVAVRFPATLKSQTLTKSWLVKIGFGLLVINQAMDVLSTYPFAGFIKEEAIQTLGFGFTSAKKSGDVPAMNAEIEKRKEFLNPTVWEKMQNKIPFFNTWKQLEKFYEAAALKLQIDERYVASLS